MLRVHNQANSYRRIRSAMALSTQFKEVKEA
jgi:hypothetical protein